MAYRRPVTCLSDRCLVPSLVVQWHILIDASWGLDLGVRSLVLCPVTSSILVLVVHVGYILVLVGGRLDPGVRSLLVLCLVTRSTRLILVVVHVGFLQLMINKGDFLIMRVAGDDPCGILVAIEQLQYIVQRRTAMIRKTLRFHHYQSNHKLLTRL